MLGLEYSTQMISINDTTKMISALFYFSTIFFGNLLCGLQEQQPYAWFGILYSSDFN